MDLVRGGALLVLGNLAYELNFSCFWDTWREIAFCFKKECSFSNLLEWNAFELRELSLHGRRVLGPILEVLKHTRYLSEVKETNFYLIDEVNLHVLDYIC